MTAHMGDGFNPNREPTRYRYQLLADHLAQLIHTGELRPNTALPAEQRLAVLFGVSLGTARHATELLRNRGLVITLRSKGTFVLGRERSIGDEQS
jgi:DNA-binding GntR family transcriptional regulator